MNKISSLLQKVDAFEKLAVLGDRSLFLKSLAQGAMLETDSHLESDPEFKAWLKDTVPYADLMDQNTIRQMWVKYQNDKAKHSPQTSKPQDSTSKQISYWLAVINKYMADPTYLDEPILQDAVSKAWAELNKITNKPLSPSQKRSLELMSSINKLMKKPDYLENPVDQKTVASLWEQLRSLNKTL